MFEKQNKALGSHNCSNVTAIVFKCSDHGNDCLNGTAAVVFLYFIFYPKPFFYTVSVFFRFCSEEYITVVSATLWLALQLTQPTSSLRLHSVSPLRQRSTRAPRHRKQLKWLLGKSFSGRACHATPWFYTMESKTPSPPEGRTLNSPRIEKFSEILIRKSITCEHTRRPFQALDVHGWTRHHSSSLTTTTEKVNFLLLRGACLRIKVAT